MDDQSVLAGLGVHAEDEAIYRSLLHHPNATLIDLVAATKWQPSRVRRHLRSLEKLGLLTRTPSRPVRFIPAAPEAAVEVLALQRQEAIERARIGAARLAEQFRASAHDNLSPVTVLRGREAIAQRFFQAQQATRHEVLILDKPPYVVEPLSRQIQVQRDLLARGVSYRTIYDRSSLDSPDRLAELRDLAARGEQGRVMADVPLKLIITDRSVAMTSVMLPTQRESLVLTTSTLLDGLITLFEMLWQRATPLWVPGGQAAGDHDVPTEEEQQLLALSAAGLTDEAMARRLGVAQRTVERRMRKIMDRLGAQTRFQAGLQAARLGILGGTPS